MPSPLLPAKHHCNLEVRQEESRLISWLKERRRRKQNQRLLSFWVRGTVRLGLSQTQSLGSGSVLLLSQQKLTLDSSPTALGFGLRNNNEPISLLSQKVLT